MLSGRMKAPLTVRGVASLSHLPSTIMPMARHSLAQRSWLDYDRGNRSFKPGSHMLYLIHATDGPNMADKVAKTLEAHQHYLHHDGAKALVLAGGMRAEDGPGR